MSGSIALGASNGLSLAAAPTFALMALLTAYAGGNSTTVMCGQEGQPSLLTGMAPMYLLMAAFHLVPWFKLSGQP